MTEPRSTTADSAPSPLRLTRTDWLIAAGLLLAAFVPLARALLLPGVTAYGHDISYHYALATVMRSADGPFPLWNPYWWSGMPFVANPQTSVFYPGIVIFRWLPLDTMFDVAGWFHMWLAGLGMYALMRDFGLRRMSSVFSAVAFMFSGAVVPRFDAGYLHFIYSVAWSGWLVLFYRRLLRSRSRTDFVAVALNVGFVLLAGHPQYSLMVLLTPAVYGLYVLIGQAMARRWQALSRTLILSVGAAGFGGALAAVQIVPTLNLLSHTARASGLTYDAATMFALHPLLLAHIVAPFLGVDALRLLGSTQLELVPTHEISPFFGILGFSLAMYAILKPGARARHFARFYAVIALAGLLLSLGSHTPLYKLFYTLMPTMRAPGRFLTPYIVSLTMVAGVGVELLVSRYQTRQLRRDRLAFWVNLLTVGVGLLLVATVIMRLDRRFPLTVPALLVTVTGVALLGWAIARRRMSANAVALWAIALALVEGLLFAWPLHAPKASPFQPDSPYAQLSIEPSGVRLGDVPRNPVSYGIPSSGGEEPAQLATLADVITIGMEPGERGAQLMAAGFVVTDAPLDDPAFDLMQQANSAYLYEHEGNWPRIIAAPAVEVVVSDEAALVRVADPAFDPFAAAIVTAADGGPDLPTASPGGLAWEAAYTCYEADRICATVETGAPALVVFSETFYPGWTAVVDGKSARIWQVNYAFRGVMVDAGEHVVEMRYESRPFKIGQTISLTSVGILVLMTLISVQRLYCLWRHP